MRVYLPLVTAERSELGGGPAVEIDLSEGRTLWGVGASALADSPGEEAEDLEYEALQDAVFAGMDAVGPTTRILAVAADLPERLLAVQETAGRFGLRLLAPARAQVVSLHVTELGRAAAQASDTDPALLWFDRTEAADAVRYAAGREV